MHLREGRKTTCFDRAHTMNALGREVSVNCRPDEYGWVGGLDNQYVAADDKVKIVGPATRDDWAPDNSHMPDPFTFPYLLSGDYWYLEQMYFLGNVGLRFLQLRRRSRTLLVWRELVGRPG